MHATPPKHNKPLFLANHLSWNAQWGSWHRSAEEPISILCSPFLNFPGHKAGWVVCVCYCSINKHYKYKHPFMASGKPGVTVETTSLCGQRTTPFKYLKSHPTCLPGGTVPGLNLYLSLLKPKNLDTFNPDVLPSTDHKHVLWAASKLTSLSHCTHKCTLGQNCGPQHIQKRFMHSGLKHIMYTDSRWLLQEFDSVCTNSLLTQTVSQGHLHTHYR